MEARLPGVTACGTLAPLFLFNYFREAALFSRPDCKDPRGRTVSFISGSAAAGSGLGTELVPVSLLDNTWLGFQL